MAVIPKLSQRIKLQIMVTDALLYGASVVILYYLRLGYFKMEYLFSPGLWFLTLSLCVVNYILGLFDLDTLRGRVILVRSSLALTLFLLLTMAVHYVLAKDRSGLFGRGVFFGAALSYFFLSNIVRLEVRRFFKKRTNKTHWMIICDQSIDEKMQKDQVINSLRGQYTLVPIEKGVKYFHDLFESQINIRQVGLIVAIPSSSFTNEFKKALLTLKMNGHDVLSWADFIEKTLRKIPVEYVTMDWLLFQSGYGLLRYTSLIRVKRVHDVFVSLIVIALTWPLMLITALGVKMDSKGPILYRQTRAGLGGKPFTIYKFRSMRIDAEDNGPQWAQEKDHRVTRWGSFIRKIRLDELPQLWNVLMGHMSFIGPRPERPEFNSQLESKIPYYNFRHLVRPGITGWAQILYPYGASERDAKNKLEYDLYYIKNYSILLDWTILLKTVKVILFGQGR